MATDKPRFSLTVPEELLKKIDDFRFENRFNTRNDAVTTLIEMALKALTEEKKEEGAQ